MTNNDSIMREQAAAIEPNFESLIQRLCNAVERDTDRGTRDRDTFDDLCNRKKELNDAIDSLQAKLVEAERNVALLLQGQAPRGGAHRTE